MSRVAVVTALEREIRPLVRHWSVREKEHDGRRFRFFEKDDVVLVCGGIGAEAGRRATGAVIALYSPRIVYSAGFAGALEPALRVGDVVLPHRVVNAGDGSSVTLDQGDGVLVSFASVAGARQKNKLRESFCALAVDMEAAGVARAAETRGVEFRVIKVISDEAGFELPPMEQFVDSQGRFLELRFALFAAVRPWIWRGVWRLMRNSNRAALVLCRRLEALAHSSVPMQPRETVRRG